MKGRLHARCPKELEEQVALLAEADHRHPSDLLRIIAEEWCAKHEDKIRAASKRLAKRRHK